MLRLDAYLKYTPAMCNEPNLTSHFSDQDLARIGTHCHEGYQRDEDSRADWLRRSQAGMDLAMQICEEKSFPWPGAANVAFPLTTIAALQFHSRAYPAMFAGPDIVKYRVPGSDDKGQLTANANLVARYMSHQALDLDESFEEQHDRLLINVPIVGCAFIKTRRDASKNINTSTLVLARDLVVDYYAKSINDCARKTQIIPLYRNEIYERCVAGTFHDVLEEAWYKTPFLPPTTPYSEERDNIAGKSVPQADEATPILFGEQHCWLDLDNDGYAEPYIITFDLANKKVVRIACRWERPEDVEKVGGRVLRITATEYFTKYGLIPAPDGSIYDVGFGALLGPLNESVNTIVNQLLDSGTMSVAAGGFIARGVKIRGGAIQFQPFGWQRVDSTGDDLRKGIFPLPKGEPSAVLFQLLSLLINYTQRISGSGDTMVGENPGQNTPANNMNIMLEQGMQVYSAIFKRMWRSMRDEFRKCFVLNARHMDAEVKFGTATISRSLFLEDPSNLVPAADPNLVSDSSRQQQAMMLKQFAAATPGYDIEAVERNVLRVLRVDNADALYPGLEKFPPPENPKLAIEKLRQQREQLKLQVNTRQFMFDLQEQKRLNDAKIEQLEAQAAVLFSQAKGAESAQQLEAFEAVVTAYKTHNDVISQRIAALKQAADAQEPASDGQPGASNVDPTGGISGVAPPPSNAGLPVPAQ